MSYANSHRFSIGGFAIACALTVAVNGSMLLGFNHLAQSHDAVNAHAASQLAAAIAPASKVTM